MNDVDKRPYPTAYRILKTGAKGSKGENGVMGESYYRPCRELDICNELIEKYWSTRQFEKCFEGHLALAKQGYPLAECQVGYFYLEGYGVEKDVERALYWTRLAAEHGDWDAQFNLASMYEKGIGVRKDMKEAIRWYRRSALQNHEDALQKCAELGVDVTGERAEVSRENTIRLWFDMWLRRKDLGIAEVFSPDAVYIESWGPEYHGSAKIAHWFDEWNTRGRVVRWDIERFFHQGDQTVAQWTFECEMNGAKADTFDGMTLVRWTPDGKIGFLQEFGCNLNRYDPYAEGSEPVFRNDDIPWF